MTDKNKYCYKWHTQKRVAIPCFVFLIVMLTWSGVVNAQQRGDQRQTAFLKYDNGAGQQKSGAGVGKPQKPRAEQMAKLHKQANDLRDRFHQEVTRWGNAHQYHNLYKFHAHASDVGLMRYYHLSGTVVVVSFIEQICRIYQNGKLIKAFQVTTGNFDSPSPAGLWHIFLRQSPTVFRSSASRITIRMAIAMPLRGATGASTCRMPTPPGCTLIRGMGQR